MYNHTTILAQMQQLADRLGFDKICEETETNKRYRTFDARTQLFAMMLPQLSHQNGLRSIEGTLASDNDLYHAGIKANITRTNLAHANANRNPIIFQKFYFHLLEHYKFLAGKKAKRETQNLKLIDATTVSLNKNQFAWATFRKTKSGIKIHTRFDYDLKCAGHIFMTNASCHENGTLKEMQLTENDIAVFDRGYFSKKQFLDFVKSGISFVTRLKTGVKYEILSESNGKTSKSRGLSKNDEYEIISDERIEMEVQISKNETERIVLRKIASRDLETKKEIELLTSMFDLDALDVAYIYKKRWEVELYFKALKQNLKIKKFYGRSENAVKTQIWIALIVHLFFLILKLQHPESRHTFSSFCCEIAVVLFKHRSLDRWFCGDFEKYRKKPPPLQQTTYWLFAEFAS